MYILNHIYIYIYTVYVHIDMYCTFFDIFPGRSKKCPEDGDQAGQRYEAPPGESWRMVHKKGDTDGDGGDCWENMGELT